MSKECGSQVFAVGKGAEYRAHQVGERLRGFSDSLDTLFVAKFLSSLES